MVLLFEPGRAFERAIFLITTIVREHRKSRNRYHGTRRLSETEQTNLLSDSVVRVYGIEMNTEPEHIWWWQSSVYLLEYDSQFPKDEEREETCDAHHGTHSQD